MLQLGVAVAGTPELGVGLSLTLLLSPSAVPLGAEEAERLLSRFSSHTIDFPIRLCCPPFASVPLLSVVRRLLLPPLPLSLPPSFCPSLFLR